MNNSVYYTTKESEIKRIFKLREESKKLSIKMSVTFSAVIVFS